MSPILRLLILALLTPALAFPIERPIDKSLVADTPTQGIIFHLLLPFLAPPLALPAALAHADVSYLTSESFDLPLDSIERQTVRPLTPGETYRVTIFSDSFNLAHIANDALLFTDGTRALVLTMSAIPPTAARNVITMLVDGTGHRLRVRSREHWFNPLTVVVRFTIEEDGLPTPAPQPRTIPVTAPAPALPAPPVPGTQPAKITTPWLLALGFLTLSALAALYYWRISAPMRRLRELQRLTRHVERAQELIDEQYHTLRQRRNTHV